MNPLFCFVFPLSFLPVCSAAPRDNLRERSLVSLHLLTLLPDAPLLSPGSKMRECHCPGKLPVGPAMPLFPRRRLSLFMVFWKRRKLCSLPSVCLSLAQCCSTFYTGVLLAISS